MDDLAALLPSELAGATITSLGPRASRAAVYRVEHASGTFVLKRSAIDQFAARAWVQQRAAEAGIAPRVIHVDEARQCIVSELVEDRSFPMWYGTQREAALARLGEVLRQVQALPIPPELVDRDPRAELRAITLSVDRPAYVDDEIARVLAEVPPPRDRVVLAHNDVNPGNLVYDGTRLLLVDWDVTGPADPYYDAAAIAVFLRMDDASCCELLGEALPDRFLYDRRLVAALCGATFLGFAERGGHAGDREAAPLPLAELYARLRSGGIDLASPSGQYAFGLALLTHASTL
jgi:aminoglycoside phosphotransferase